MVKRGAENVAAGAGLSERRRKAAPRSVGSKFDVGRGRRRKRKLYCHADTARPRTLISLKSDYLPALNGVQPWEPLLNSNTSGFDGPLEGRRTARR